MAQVQGRPSAVAAPRSNAAEMVAARAPGPPSARDHWDQADAGQVHRMLQPRAAGLHGVPGAVLPQVLPPAADLRL